MTDNIEVSNKRIFGLDLIRASAIIMVVISHSLWIFPNNNSWVTKFLNLLGFFGVEIFFVLSGFLIGKILFNLFVKNETCTFKQVVNFLKRRWYRTLPNYFLILILNIILVFFLGNINDHVWRYFFFIQNAICPMPNFFPESWSLTIEEFAYILLPVSLFLVFKYFKNNNKSKLFLKVVLGLILVVIITKWIYYSTTSNTTLAQWNLSLKAVVIYRLDAIFIGVFFSGLCMIFPFFWKKMKMICALFGCLLLTMMFVGVGLFHILIDTHPFFWNVCYLPLTSIAFAFFLPLFSEINSGVSIIKFPIVFISKISYSMYLLHYSLILQLLKFYWNKTNYTSMELSMFLVFYLTITVVLSWILYYFYENYFLKKREKIRII